MTDVTELNQIKAKILPVLQQYGVQRAYLFGSTVRGDATPTSDIDLMIDGINQPGLFAFMKLQFQLEDIINKKVDLIMEEGIKPYLKNSIYAHTFQVI
jgi:predicted nucleotidyltransferase